MTAAALMRIYTEWGKEKHCYSEHSMVDFGGDVRDLFPMPQSPRKPRRHNGGRKAGEICRGPEGEDGRNTIEKEDEKTGNNGSSCRGSRDGGSGGNAPLSESAGEDRAAGAAVYGVFPGPFPAGL